MKTYTIRHLTFNSVEPRYPDFERWMAKSVIGKFRIERENSEWAWQSPTGTWHVCKDLHQGILLANEALTRALEADTLSECVPCE